MQANQESAGGSNAVIARRNRSPWLRLAPAVVACVALALYLGDGPLRSPGAFVTRNAIDFIAAYCGTRVAAAGGDPYRVEPLRACEHTVIPLSNPKDAWVVVPAPLPSYTFVLLRPILFAPFAVARAVWIALGLAALLVAGYCAARVCALPAIPVVFAFIPAIGLLNIYYGEPIPLAIALIGAAALCAHRGRDAAAGVFAALALLEPHIGLGACAGAFFGLPRARIPLLATGVALAIAGVAALGFERNLEYFTVVLPAQAHAELAVNYQLSLAHALTLAGVAPKPALTLGSLSYAFTLAAGVLAACVFVRAGAPAAALYLPVTFTLLGGTYVHAPEIAAALPGVLLLTRISGLPQAGAIVALALLIVPWNAGASNITSVPLGLAAVFVATALVRRRDGATLTVAAALSAIVALYIAFIPAPEAIAHARAAVPSAIHAADPASTAWEMYVSATRWLLDEDRRRIMLKIPLWLGLALAIAAAVWASRPANRADLAKQLYQPARPSP